MGVLRRHWRPTIQSSDLSEVGVPPLRLQLLSSFLMEFGDTEVFMVESKREAHGVGFPYYIHHGWKLNITRSFVEVMQEFFESTFRAIRRQKRSTEPCGRSPLKCKPEVFRNLNANRIAIGDDGTMVQYAWVLSVMLIDCGYHF
jgi:hypothetical protein